MLLFGAPKCIGLFARPWVPHTAHVPFSCRFASDIRFASTPGSGSRNQRAVSGASGFRAVSGCSAHRTAFRRLRASSSSPSSDHRDGERTSSAAEFIPIPGRFPVGPRWDHRDEVTKSFRVVAVPRPWPFVHPPS